MSGVVEDEDKDIDDQDREMKARVKSGNKSEEHEERKN